MASTYEDTIIAGFVRAFDDGADIISASLGSSVGFPDSRIAVLASRMVEQGVFVVVAAGNSGDNGTTHYYLIVNTLSKIIQDHTTHPVFPMATL